MDKQKEKILLKNLFLILLAALIVPCFVAQASCTPGTFNDIGIAVNNDINSLGSSCGTVLVSTGNYTLATRINKPRCVVLDFQNSVVTSCILNGAAIATGSDPATDSSYYTWGGIRNLKLVGPGTSNAGSVGLWLGGDATGTNAPAAWNDYISQYSNLNIQNFESGVAKGEAYQVVVIGSSFTNNKYGWYDPGQFGSENLMLYGDQFLNNAQYGLYSANMAAAQYNCTSCSFDYNGVSGLYYTNGVVRLIAGHIEQPSGYLIDGPASSTLAFSLDISGGEQFYLTNSGGSDTAFIHVQGNNSNVRIGAGLKLDRRHTVGNVIQWDATGSSNLLNMEPYVDANTPTAVALPAVQASANIQFLHIPLYSQYVPTSEYFSNLTVGSPNQGDILSSNYVGSQGNNNGVVPPASRFPYNGNFLGWNTENIGEADHFNPYSSAANSNDAFAWYANLSGTFQKVSSIQRNGFFNATGGYSVSGNPGFTGTKVSGTCVFTITGGIITNVTGC